MSRPVRTSASSKAAEAKNDAYFLKSRVEELEAEVAALKKRLDDLRKAKNTTVHKKQKEYVTTSMTEHRSSNDPKVSDLQQKMDDLNLQHTKEMEELKRSHQESLRKMKKTSPSPTSCNHEEEIASLKQQNKSLQSDNEELRLFNEELKKENGDLREKFEELFSELSIKEAQWCEKEEQLNLKMKLQWGEKYREWMEVTEKKIADLQAANDLLRSYMKHPDGT
ncbi:myosin-6-like [Acanthaster planci]|uniref:Myosin-6-like n=1 Tax=Acanthaster planci TaxID=133434 RepID=A0A8B7ZA13_ACAPL|nr:myosin-6-like [Acanthaster planci]